MMSLWDALRMNMMISYQELVRTFLKCKTPSTNAKTGNIYDSDYHYNAQKHKRNVQRMMISCK